MKITIDNFVIGDTEPTFIIAEAGLNHDGDLSQAKRLIKSAASSGADSIKFQIFKAEEISSPQSDYYDLFKSLELSDEEWIDLAEYADSNGILFTASVFGTHSVDLFDEIESPLYKVASGDLTYLQLLSQIARKKKPIVLSTGMSSICEIEEALNVVYNEGNQNIALMHCVSNYPTNYEDTNLNFIKTLKKLFKVPVGFSDHTIGTLIPALAVVMGADLVEKHFTLDQNLPGPDHQLSLEPGEFKSMVKNIRLAETSTGSQMKTITEDEKNLRSLARRSITAKKYIKKGEILTEDKIKYLRPGTGIEPKFGDLIIGKTVKNDIDKDQQLQWDDL
ncbi:N-acetylneuraminate synthase family protein [Methanobacterium sp. BAmetb5]|uniref:N-acetylneuraminate synthase family protein n=1 Tax=Methanobacterium sp. BAmetb5 TaxID=2025351 RepID=UPI000E985CBD|nr:N-acetylneuraminate synthase family protein [Methanobacterium sp. BAmetb5]AXV38918.1 MAG: N-acetylneuraminate synthase [Methanobacterium sp. BAmetb5]